MSFEFNKKKKKKKKCFDPLQDLLPLVFMFELPILQPIPDVSGSPAIQQIQQTHNVTVTFKQRPNVYVTTVVVRGSVNNAKSVKEATMLLIEHLTATIAVSNFLLKNGALDVCSGGGGGVRSLMSLKRNSYVA